MSRRRRNHPNTLKLAAYDAGGAVVSRRPGCRSAAASSCATARRSPGTRRPPIRCRSATPPICLASPTAHGLSIAELVRRNEEAVADADAVEARLDAILAAMFACLDRGLLQEGRASRRAESASPRQGHLRPAEGRCRPQRPRRARDHGFRLGLCDGGQRGERRRRARRHRADQRRGRRHPRGAALLPRPLRRRRARAGCATSC